MFKLLILAVCLTSSSLWAQSVSAILGQQFSQLQKKIGQGDPQTMALNAHKNRARIESFAIQGITRLFDKEKKVFKEIKKNIKVFEDHLGQIAKWDDLRSLPQLSSSQSLLYKKNYEAELKKLSDYLRQTNFTALLSRYNQEVAGAAISESDTKKIVLAGIQDEIDDIIKKEYDFTYGETGLHELRRNLRWPLIELDVFKDYFTTKKTTCQKTDFYNLGSKSRYASIKENPKASFSVDYCSYIQLVGAVEYIGKLKDGLEQAGVLDDKVSPELFTSSTKVSKELKENILPQLL